MHIVLTAVPAGFGEKPQQLRLAVVVTFRREASDVELSQMLPLEREALTNWPAFVSNHGLQFKITVAPPAGPAAAQWTTANSLAPINALNAQGWENLFNLYRPFSAIGGGGAGGGAPVNTTKPRAVTSFPLAKLKQSLRYIYWNAMDQHLGAAAGGGAPAGQLPAVATQLNFYATDIAGNRIPSPDLPAGGGGGGAAAPEDPFAAITFPQINVNDQLTPAEIERRGLRNVYRLAPDPDNPLHGNIYDFLMGKLARAQVTTHSNVGGAGGGAAATAFEVEPPGIHEFLQLSLFHRRAPKASPMISDAPTRTGAAGGAPAASSAQTIQDLDVFQQLAMVYNYPALLQPLGLVLILTPEFNNDQWSRLAAGGRIQVSLEGAQLTLDGAPLPTVLPWTRFTFSVPQRTFLAADRDNGFLCKGFLDLTNCRGNPAIPADRFQLFNQDLDGTGLKVTGTASITAREIGAVAFTHADDPLGIIKEANAAATDLISGIFDKRIADLAVDPNVFLSVTNDDLRNTAWSTIQFDTQLKTNRKEDEPRTSLKGTAERMNGSLTRIRWQLFGGGGYRTDDDVPLSATRTTGIGVIWRNRGTDVFATGVRRKTLTDKLNGTANDAKKAKKANVPLDDPASDLYAEDLILGYVPEVSVINSNRSGYGPWRSLSDRREEFGLAAFAGVNKDHDGRRNGILRLAATTPLDASPQQDPGPAIDVHVGEAVLNWTGHTLGVDPPEAQRMLDGQQKTSDSKQGLVARMGCWKVPVQLSVPAASVVPYRFAPPGLTMPQYRLRMRAVDVSGLQMDQASAEDGPWLPFTVRRHEAVPPPELLLDRPLDHNVPGRGLLQMVVTHRHDEDVRWAVPPRTSFEMAERHGMVDVPSLKDLGSFDDILLRQDGSFPVSPAPPDKATQSGGAKDPAFLPIRYARPFHQSIDLPYYPDPLARSLAIRLVYQDGPAAGGKNQTETKMISFYNHFKDWPHARAIRISLRATSHSQPTLTVTWDQAIEVQLPPGMAAALELCCALGNSAKEACEETSCLAILDDYYQLQRGNATTLKTRTPGTPDAPKEESLNFVPLLRPLVRVELLHAVPLPLEKPQIVNIRRQVRRFDAPPTFARDLGKPEARLTFDLRAEPSTTGKIRLQANWADNVDVIPDPPRRINSMAQLGEMQIEPWLARGMVPLLPLSVRHVLQSTSYHRVTYRAVGTTRYREQFPNLPTAQLEAPADAYVVDVLNCARPAAPRVAYVSPTFGWEQQETERPMPRFSSTRKGGGLRVWLERPWFSSGDGELLGVVLWPPVAQVPAAGPASDQLARRNLTTNWGLDPARSYQPLDELPTYELFKGADHIGHNILLPELKHPVTVVGYTPTFDSCEDRWYCDIAIDPVPAEWCFIRMALVRYQPNSISGVEISTAVLADFAQLLPDRTVTVYRDHEDKRQLTLRVDVFGSTPNLAAPQQPAAANVIRSCGIEVAVYAQADNGSWVEEDDQEIRVEPIQSSERDATWLWSGKVVWSRHKGVRRLVVRERELINHANTVANSCEEGRIIYMDVLEL